MRGRIRLINASVAIWFCSVSTMIAKPWERLTISATLSTASQAAECIARQRDLRIHKATCKMMMLIMMMMMMKLHQMRHGRQDNHATNQVRCTKTRNTGQSRKHSEAKQSETSDLSNEWSTTPAKQSTGKHPVGAYGGSTTARHGRKGTWMRTVKKG